MAPPKPANENNGFDPELASAPEEGIEIERDDGETIRFGATAERGGYDDGPLEMPPPPPPKPKSEGPPARGGRLMGPAPAPLPPMPKSEENDGLPGPDDEPPASGGRLDGPPRPLPKPENENAGGAPAAPGCLGGAILLGAVGDRGG